MSQQAIAVRPARRGPGPMGWGIGVVVTVALVLGAVYLTGSRGKSRFVEQTQPLLDAYTRLESAMSDGASAELVATYKAQAKAEYAKWDSATAGDHSPEIESAKLKILSVNSAAEWATFSRGQDDERHELGVFRKRLAEAREAVDGQR